MRPFPKKRNGENAMLEDADTAGYLSRFPRSNVSATIMAWAEWMFQRWTHDESSPFQFHKKCSSSKILLSNMEKRLVLISERDMFFQYYRCP